MSHQPPPPASSALPPSLYSGMSSLHINQSETGHFSGSSPQPITLQPQKNLRRTYKVENARHRGRKAGHSSSAASHRDPREAALVAGRTRILKDDAEYREAQYEWRPFPPDARPTSRKDSVETFKGLNECLDQEIADFREMRRDVAAIRTQAETNGQNIKWLHLKVKDWRCKQERESQESIERILDPEERQRAREHSEARFSVCREASARAQIQIFGNGSGGSQSGL